MEFAFFARWAHFLAGITWIGLLYYFNFVQVPGLGAAKDVAAGAVLITAIGAVVIGAIVFGPHLAAARGN